MDVKKMAVVGATIVLLAGGIFGGAALADSASTVTSKEQALAELNSAQSELRSAQARLDAVRGYVESLPATPPPTTTTPPPTTTTPPPTTTTPVPASKEAAVLFNWGAPVVNQSDEFNYVGAPNPNKWYNPGSGSACWPGHIGNGKRCGDRSNVDGSKLIMSGLANGNTGLIGQQVPRQYGRWEARIRTVGASTGRTYHPVMIIWPANDQWPQNGEYDFFENDAPSKQSVTAFMHYPHNPGPVQQIQHVQPNVDTTLWNNIAFEWTPQYVAGYINGVQWFKDSGGATSTRRDIQTMTSGKMTIQLDNFFGTDMVPGQMEIDWVRTYNLS